MAKPAKKSEPAPPAERRVLSMELRVGDRIADETGEWKVIGRPYTTKRREGRARPRWDVSQPDVTEIRMWGAHERVAIHATSQIQEQGPRLLTAVREIRDQLGGDLGPLLPS